MRVEVMPDLAATRRFALTGWFTRLGEQWCRWMHSDITWPVNGYYSCRKCYRRFPVPWEKPPAQAPVVRARPRRAEESLPAFAEATI